jgi:hypothetical protein
MQISWCSHLLYRFQALPVLLNGWIGFLRLGRHRGSRFPISQKLKWGRFGTCKQYAATFRNLELAIEWWFVVKSSCSAEFLARRE